MAQQKAVEPAVDEAEDLIDELQPGAKLLKGQYTISRYINSGGFGITYLAKDSLDRDVVIKECFPSSVCRRSKVVVAARSRAHTAELRSIVQLFVREARNLAKIVHPNIVAVHQVFEDNGTAYMAIDFIDGLDLQQIIDGEGARLTPDHIVQITEKLLRAVGFIHDHDMLHRDISPDNVLIDKAGEPILIDFGAAREKASQSNRAMSALRVVKDGYSPQEFYIAGSEQGPWSDLYALGATLYHLISGDAPVNGQARLAALAEDRPDPYLPLAGRFPDYPKGFLEAIDRAMNTLPRQRLQSAKDWLAMFTTGLAPVAASTTGATVLQRPISERLDAGTQSAAAVSAPPPLAKAASRPAMALAEPAVEVSRGKSPVQLVAGVAIALVVVAGGYMMLGGKASAPAADSQSMAADPAPIAAAKPADTTADAPQSAAAEPVEPVEAATPASAAAAVTPVAEPVAKAEEPKAVAEPEPAAAKPAEVAATEPEAATPAAATPEVVAPAATATEVLAAPVGKPAENQVAFAAWDVEIPFSSDDRMVDGKRVAIVTRIPPAVDAKEAGDWLAPGVTIYAVNGTPIQSSGSITVAVMNAMSVDPDGKARVVVEYSDASRQKKSGLLTVSVVRLVNLQNGVGVRTSAIDGVWKTTVTGVTQPEITSLRQGDVLFRDKTTKTPLDGPTSLETIMGDLVAGGTTQTGFSIIRDNKVGEAHMQLVLDGGP
ncbi:MAG: serine/threonine protein kinase [Rhodobacterales bacterium]|nr:serine/threonine protein kinase [Rhodobacterales bacterium]